MAITLASTGAAGPRAAFAAVTGLTQTAQAQVETAATGAADGADSTTTPDAAQGEAADNASENNGGNTASANPNAADAGQSTAASSMDSRITEFSLKWSTSKNQGEYFEFNGNELTMKPAYNRPKGGDIPGGSVATAELTLGISQGNGTDGDEIPAGALKVELPAYIFNKRDSNQPQGGYRIGISRGEGDNVLRYMLNEHGTPDDPSDDTIDITNKVAITDSYRWTVEIAYHSTYMLSNGSDRDVLDGLPGNVADIAGGEGDRGYSREFQARLSVTSKNGEKFEKGSEELAVRYRTKVAASVRKSLQQAQQDQGYAFLTKQYDEAWWTSNGRKVPDDADEYFYALWTVYNYSSNITQDGNYKIVDTPDPNTKGEVVAWRTARGEYKAPQTDGSYIWSLENDDTEGMWNYGMPGGVLLRYPKSLLESGSVTLNNSVSLTYTGKDGDTASSSSKASRVWDVQAFTYPPGHYDPLKSGLGNNLLGINELEKVDKGELAETPYEYTFGSDNYGTDLIFKPGANKLTDQPSRKWTVDASDDFVGISSPGSSIGERLSREDYAISSISVESAAEQMAEEDPTGQNEYILVTTPKEKWPEVTIWYETNLDTEPGYSKESAWHKLGKLQYTNLADDGKNSAYAFTYEDGRSLALKKGDDIALPEGVVGVRYSYDTYSVRSMLELGVKIKLRATDKTLSAIKGQDSVSLTNIASMSVFDDAGNFVNKSDDSSVLPQAYRDEVIKRDKVFDSSGLPMHRSAVDLVQRNNASSLTDKYITGTQIKNDPATQSVVFTYGLDSVEQMTSNNGDFSLEEAKKYGFQEQTAGVFYELLPAGMTVDLNSLTAWKFDQERHKNHVGYTPQQTRYQASASLTENWRGSGRAMLTVRVQVPDGETSASVWKSAFGSADRVTVYSGFHIEFTVRYPWQSFDDYGPSVKNIAAFRSSGEIADGQPDDGKFAGGTGMPSFSDADTELMKDLDNNGNPADEPSNVVYMSNSATLEKLGSTQVTTGKFVRAAGNTVWKTGDTADGEEQVTSGQGYSYQLSLRGGQSDGDKRYTKAKGIVMYDNLEDFADTQSPARARWHGTINSVDLSLAKLRGISPKVYYATETRDLSDAANRDLTDTSKWTATDESFSNASDKSQVKAIAIDLSTKSDGKEFVLNGDTESIRAVINMTAPTKGAYQLQKQGAVALNDAYLVADVESTAGNGWGQAQLPAGPTRVSISADVASFEFEKRGGEDDQAAPVDGAVFRLWRWTGAGEAPSGLIDPDNPGEGWELATDEATGNPVGDADGNVTSGAGGITGLVSFPNLDKGTYRLVEVKAPTGFMLPSGQWSVIVDPALSTSYKVMVSAIAGADGKLPPAFGVKGTGTDASLYVGNKPVPYLPSSGAAGTLLLTGAGLALVGAAAVLAWQHVRATRKDTSAS